MKIRKVLGVFLLLTLALFIAGCDTTGDLNSTREQDLRNALAELTDNYELEVNIYFYDELEAEAIIKVDGNKSYYKEGEFVEFYYLREGLRDLTIYQKEGDSFNVTNSNDLKDIKYDIFRLFKYQWFTYSNNKYLLKEEYYEDLREAFNFENEEIELKAAEVVLTNKVLSDLRVTFEQERDLYYFYFKVKNINKVVIEIPEVN
ncbi:MAG: hypothetical protein RBS76_05385 [Acholeplasmatales bacterium]|nr:hypothetical protein [Acholeplasmataceae bacterium]MCK9289553.1 hypothetical protein [Acholeplasmataceae bacterium]MCK9427605.1 hypothetical protein [Acholeplasmataceae bacterium]MDY0115909.1 hypothetical protein [Acholeplasmatales bacterium]HHT39116.1 hypothetical protein [Acholeplasmataceae bacterium]